MHFCLFIDKNNTCHGPSRYAKPISTGFKLILICFTYRKSPLVSAVVSIRPSVSAPATGSAISTGRSTFQHPRCRCGRDPAQTAGTHNHGQSGNTDARAASNPKMSSALTSSGFIEATALPALGGGRATNTCQHPNARAINMNARLRHTCGTIWALIAIVPLYLVAGLFFLAAGLIWLGHHCCSVSVSVQKKSVSALPSLKQIVTKLQPTRPRRPS